MRKFIHEYSPSFNESDSKAVADVVASGWISEGKLTKEFEEKVASVMGYKFGVATCNGTIAISLGLWAMDFKAGDTISMPDFAFVATANAISMIGAKPKFRDVKASDFNADFLHVPVALNGRGVGTLSHSVLDAAQALGSNIEKSGIATLSFAPPKMLVTGQGGMLFTDSKEVEEKIRRLKDHGRLDKADYHPSRGFDFKFTDLQAALGLSQLRRLPKRIQQKQAIFNHYRDELGDLCPPFKDGELLMMQDILVNDRNRLVVRLLKLGIQTRPFYCPLHTQPVYKTNWRFPVTERISATGLWLPSSPDLSSEEVSFICDSIKRRLK